MTNVKTGTPRPAQVPGPWTAFVPSATRGFKDGARKRVRSSVVRPAQMASGVMVGCLNVLTHERRKEQREAV